MIRLVYVLRRQPEMSLAGFQKYWRGTHGPMVARHAEKLDILRYVQLHTLDDPVNAQLAGARGKMEAPYDGVAELWWNSRDALAKSFMSGAGQSASRELLEDEGRFIDLPNSPMWFAHEYPQVNPTPENMVADEHSSLVKLFFCLRHPPSQGLEQAQLYWRTNHGPTIRRIAPAMRMKRYLQVHRCEEVLEHQMRASRGTKVPPYMGHAEAWFDRADLTAVGQAPEGRRAAEIAVEDERKFIDFANSAMWIGKEWEFIDRR
ncbi:MAG TPA: EthD domain-containing protein [Candidatus Binataceae bacterium]|nr:EthD domain-containing protein [Candidatus Binataceae bacterium]